MKQVHIVTIRVAVQPVKGNVGKIMFTCTQLIVDTADILLFIHVISLFTYIVDKQLDKHICNNL